MAKRKPNRSGLPAATPRHPEPTAAGLLFGRHAVFAALANPRRQVDDLICLEPRETDLRAYIDGLPETRREVLPRPRVVRRADFHILVGPDSVHQGLAVRVQPLAGISLADLIDHAGPTTLVVVLDQVTDPHNIGAIVRSAAAFGAEAVIVQDRHAPQAGPVIAKTASGALDVVPLIRVTNLARALRTLQQAAFWCIGLAEQGDRPLHRADAGGRTALVLGAEGAGLRRLTREACDLLVHLPTVPPIRSLNVSAAAAIALHHAAIARSDSVDSSQVVR